MTDKVKQLEAEKLVSDVEKSLIEVGFIVEEAKHWNQVRVQGNNYDQYFFKDILKLTVFDLEFSNIYNIATDSYEYKITQKIVKH